MAYRSTKSVLAVIILCFVLLQTYFLISTLLYMNGDVSPETSIIDREAAYLYETGKRHNNEQRTIHFIWKTNDLSTYPHKASMDSWKANSKYNVRLWADSDTLSLFETKYPEFLPAYLSYPVGIQRADMARLAILHSEGGMYVDLDVFIPSNPNFDILDNLIDEIDPISSDESTNEDPTKHWHTGLPISKYGISNFMIISRKNSSFIYAILQEISSRQFMSQFIVFPFLRVMWSTGPAVVTQSYHKFSKKENIVLLEHDCVVMLIKHEAGRSWLDYDGWFLMLIVDNFRISFDNIHNIVVLALFLIAVVLFKLNCWEKVSFSFTRINSGYYLKKR